MKKINIIIFIFVLVISVVVYKDMNLYFNVKIQPTKLAKAPVEGNWIVVKYIRVGSSNLTNEEAEKFIGNKAAFASKEVKFNKDVCKNPNYKIKLVDAENYFMTNFKVKPSVFGISESKVKIITVSSKNSFFDEFILINNNYMIKSYEGVLLFMQREGMNVQSILDKPQSSQTSEGEKEFKAKNGLLLGLRYQDGSGYNYKTIWISHSGGNDFSIKQVNNLLVPRKNGFSIVGVDHVQNNSIDRDEIWEGVLSKTTNSIIQQAKPSNSNINYKINFVGNEYISLENEKLKANDTGQYIEDSYLSVVPLDNIYGNSIGFSKIVRSEDSSILKRSAESFAQRNGKTLSQAEKDELETNWGIIRSRGKWILRGRVDEGDFSVGITTPNILTTYDELSIPFKEIENKFPGTVDAYTSINKDFMVVISKTDLKVVKINNGSIGNTVNTINFNLGEQAVMSQWATGNYVDNWAKLIDDISWEK